MGSFLIMGLFGVILAGLANLFFQSSVFQLAINVVAILIFAGLTAWDTQRLKGEYDVVAGDVALMQKASVMGALSLYLNFINMFQLILSFVGNRNE
jgi:FtsH-binding integral membrane protein